MHHHPIAADVATLVAGRDPQQLGAALTETARLRALLPGGPIQAHGRGLLSIIVSRQYRLNGRGMPAAGWIVTRAP